MCYYFNTMIRNGSSTRTRSDGRTNGVILYTINWRFFMNANRRIAIRGIIYRDGKILATKQKDEDGNEAENWATFGGGLDPQESLIDGLHREMIEETGITPKIGKLLFVQQFTNPDDAAKEHLEFFFLIENTADYESIDLSATTHGVLEIARSAFIDPKTHAILPAFLSELDIKDYVENDRPAYIYNNLGQEA
jgi:ADP-ribose pyrophosphatase YjhB (NUDIX family)